MKLSKGFTSIFLFCIILSIPNAYLCAQVNTEKYRTPKDFKGVAFNLEITGAGKTGNVEELEAEVEGRIDWKTGRSTTFFVTENEYEWGGRRTFYK
jgi:hypothetical protein